MLRLLTFGGLQIMRGDGLSADLANQRRRLAVLAIVAAAAPRSVPRDRLLQLLWPDATDERGRNALNQIVYNLRRELGVSPIDGATDLQVVQEVMTSDLIEFRTALAAGEHATIADLYRGPFLDGFSLPGAVEFDHWVEAERHRTHRQALGSLGQLAHAAESYGDSAAFIRWSGRLTELDPLSARGMLMHMRALERAGDVDGAIRAGKRYEALAQADEDAVSPEVLAEVARLRAVAPVAVAHAAVVEPRTPVVELLAPAVEVPTSSPAGPAREPAVTASGEEPIVVTATTPVQRRSRSMAMIGLSVASVIFCMAWLLRPRGPSLPIERGGRLLLADVQVPVSDSASARALTFALQTALQQSAQVRLVSPSAIRDALVRMGRAGDATALIDTVATEVAEREGARYVVAVTMDAADGARQLTARVIDPVSRAVLQSYTERSEPNAVLGAVDRLAARLRRAIGDASRDVAQALALPRASTASLEALRLYAAGDAAYRRGEYSDARTLFTSAITIDSGFAAAHAGLAAVSYANNDETAGDASMARALSRSERLPPRERMLIEATAARGRHDWRRAATLHRAYLIRYPDDYDVYEALGYDLMRAGSPADASVAFDTVRAHRTLSANGWLNVASINNQLGRYAQARKAHVAALRIDSTWMTKNIQNEQFGFTLLRLGFADSARMVFSALLSRDAQDQGRGHRSLAYVDLYEGRYASAIEHLRRAIALGDSPAGSVTTQIRTRALLATTLLAVGDEPGARKLLREAAARCVSSRQDPRLLFWTGKPLARIGELALVRVLVDSARARSSADAPDPAAAAAALAAEYATARNMNDSAVALARRAVALDSLATHIETLAHALARGGQWTESQRYYEILLSEQLRAIGLESQQSARLAPLALANLDRRAGRTREASAMVARFTERWPGADADLIAKLVQSGAVGPRP